MLATKAITVVIAGIAILAVVALTLVIVSLSDAANQKQDQRQPNTANPSGQPTMAQNDKQENQQGASQNEPQNIWERFVAYIEGRDKLINAISTAVIAAFTLVLAIATGILAWYTSTLVTGAERAAAREQRAYVYAQVTARHFPPQSPNRWAVSVVITNGGKTWARNVILKQTVIPQEPSDSADPWDKISWGKIDETPSILGPGETISIQFADLPFSEVPRIANGEVKRSYAIWMTYGDTVSDPPVMRQTQRSWKVNADGENNISFSNNATHNCADSDCP